MLGSVLADDSSNLATVYAAAIGAIGVVVSALLVSRRQDKTTREASEKVRPRASKEERLERLEQWRRQYAQPLLKRAEKHLNGEEDEIFDWEDDA